MGLTRIPLLQPAKIMTIFKLTTYIVLRADDDRAATPRLDEWIYCLAIEVAGFEPVASSSQN